MCDVVVVCDARGGSKRKEETFIISIIHLLCSCSTRSREKEYDDHDVRKTEGRGKHRNVKSPEADMSSQVGVVLLSKETKKENS